jgi:hypothetical protein
LVVAVWGVRGDKGVIDGKDKDKNKEKDKEQIRDKVKNKEKTRQDKPSCAYWKVGRVVAGCPIVRFFEGEGRVLKRRQRQRILSNN